MRTCSVCGESKHHSHFYRKRGRIQAHCKECEKARVRQWQIANREKALGYTRAFRERNPGIDLPQARAYAAAERELREKHRDEFDRLYRKHLRESVHA